MYDGILAKCLAEKVGYVVLAEVHEGICDAHQAEVMMQWVLKHHVFWPMMVKDCFEFSNGWKKFQKYVIDQNLHTDELHSIIKPWPFRRWDLDLIGQIHSTSSKGNKYIMVDVKWVKAIPPKEME